MSFVIRLKKETFKFSCSHFTIFSATSAERLHGHNYYLDLSCRVSGVSKDLGFAFDFNELKPIIQKACNSLDEYILIPRKSPYLKIVELKNSVKVAFGKKEYVFPKEDVKMLPIVNVTSEELARFMSKQISSKFSSKSLSVSELSVTITETHGQSATFITKT